MSKFELCTYIAGTIPENVFEWRGEAKKSNNNLSIY